MKIEAGKYYKTRDGRKVGPMKRGADGSVSAFWVCDGYPLEGAASEWFEDGSFWPDGHFNRNDRTAARDLIAEWTEDQIGTLAELDVKPGDVVEQIDGMSHDGQKHYFVCNGPDPYGTPGPWLCKSKDGDTSKGWSSSKKNCRLISRATPTPSIDLTAITTPFGLLDKATQDALIAHGGPYEWYYAEKWLDTKFCHNAPTFAHRVKPVPKRETVTKDMWFDRNGNIGHVSSGANCTITFETIDGVIDMATYRVVAK